MRSFANVIWGARCGESARRVLLGETRASGHAYSVRRGRESAFDRKAPHGLPPTSLVPTNLLDEWFEHEVKPRLRGVAAEIRYCDDFILCFQCREDAERVLAVLPKRFAKYGLTLHPEKTRLLAFGRSALSRRRDAPQPATFDFLGFTHLCAWSRRGRFTIHVRTMRKRLRRSLKAVAQWCQQHRHDPVTSQAAALNAKLRGHYQYYGRPSNYRCLWRFYCVVRRLWHKWLNRRTRGKRLVWERFQHLLHRYPLALPRICHAWPGTVSPG